MLPPSSATEADAAIATVKAVLSEQEKSLRERFDAQRAAVALALTNLEKIDAERSKAHQQRWVAQERSIAAALTAAEKAVTTAFAAQEKAVNAALAAAERAVIKAEIAAEKRFESVNEFRAQLSDQAATFLIRTEYDRAHGDLLAKIDATNSNANEVRITMAANLNEKIDLQAKTFNERMDIRMADLSSKIEVLRTAALKAEGKSSGLLASWGYLVGGIGLAVTIATVITSIIGFGRGQSDAIAAATTTAARVDEVLSKRLDALSARMNSQPASAPSR